MWTASLFLLWRKKFCEYSPCHQIALNLACLKLCLHWQSFSTIMPATTSHDSHDCTCLGHLGWRDTDGIISILLSRVAVADGFANNLCLC